MPFQVGSATDHVDLLNQLVAFLTADAVDTIVVNAGGTGYAVGDLVSVDGGTGHAATARVKTIGGGGAVTALVLRESGSYTVHPTATGDTTTALTGGGSGLTVDLTFAAIGWTVLRRSQEVASAAVVAGGSGYSVNDLLTVVGGSPATTARLKVATLSGSAVATVTVDRAGDYLTTAEPTNPVATTSSPGTGATFNLTWQGLTSGHAEVLLQGSGAGSDAIVVGIRTLDDAGGSGAYNWELSGATGYNSASPFANQPGISPGKFDAGTSAEKQGAYVPLANGTIAYWFWADPFRVVGVLKIGSTYVNFYLGWINPAAVSADYPYPLFVEGCTSLWNQVYSASITNLSGLVDPISFGASDVGPGLIRTPGGSWVTVANSGGSTGSRDKRQDCVVYPCGEPSISAVAPKNRINSSGNPVWDVYDLVPCQGSPGTPTARVQQVEVASAPVSELIPTMLIEGSPERQVLGELRGVRWVSAAGNAANLTPEDELSVGDDRWVVFQNCNRVDLWAFLAVLIR